MAGASLINAAHVQHHHLRGRNSSARRCNAAARTSLLSIPPMANTCSICEQGHHAGCKMSAPGQLWLKLVVWQSSGMIAIPLDPCTPHITGLHVAPRHVTRYTLHVAPRHPRPASDQHRHRQAVAISCPPWMVCDTCTRQWRGTRVHTICTNSYQSTPCAATL